MEQPIHDLRSHTSSTAENTSRRTISFLVVAGIHVGLAVALIAGLKAGMLDKLPEELKAEVVQPKEDVKPPPPPPPDLVKPPPPFVPPPEITVTSDPGPTTAPSFNQSTIPTPPATTPPAPVVTPSKVVGKTHDCANYYPPLSSRLNEQGDVTIHYDVGADGAITNVGLAKSSGYDRLDQAALSCVSSKWRNTPAMQGDTPVASPGHTAIVRFVFH